MLFSQRRLGISSKGRITCTLEASLALHTHDLIVRWHDLAAKTPLYTPRLVVRTSERLGAGHSRLSIGIVRLGRCGSDTVH